MARFTFVAFALIVWQSVCQSAPCLKEHQACVDEPKCISNIGPTKPSGLDAPGCLANDLCVAFIDCVVPCWSKRLDCAFKQACPFSILSMEKNKPKPTPQEIQQCAASPLCRDLVACLGQPLKPAAATGSGKITASATAPRTFKRTCYSIGDPHFKTLLGQYFDSHALGWKTMYSNGDFQIDLKQVKWHRDAVYSVAVNDAIKYTTDGGKNWETRSGGELLGPNKDQHRWQFFNNRVDVRVMALDFSHYAWAQATHAYNFWMSTSEITGAKGQCIQGKLRRLKETSAGVSFPTNPKVTLALTLSLSLTLTLTLP